MKKGGERRTRHKDKKKDEERELSGERLWEAGKDERR